MNKRTVTELWIYPVKSLGGIRIRKAPVREKGLENDRRWMLVNEKNIFFTQREHPRLALFKLAMTGDSFRIQYNKEYIDLPASAPETTRTETARVWDDQVSVIEVGNKFNDWFSQRLGIACRLMWFPEQSERAVDPQFAHQRQNVSLADAYPLLVIGQASLDDLNNRLAEPVPINRFRPNVVFAGGDPYEEDRWKEFSIGKNRFLGVKNCSRCVTTTVDQETGVKGREPLLTLSRYRKTGEDINFGRNVLAIDRIEINEGDEIFVG